MYERELFETGVGTPGEVEVFELPEGVDVDDLEDYMEIDGKDIDDWADEQLMARRVGESNSLGGGSDAQTAQGETAVEEAVNKLAQEYNRELFGLHHALFNAYREELIDNPDKSVGGKVWTTWLTDEETVYLLSYLKQRIMEIIDKHGGTQGLSLTASMKSRSTSKNTFVNAKAATSMVNALASPEPTLSSR